MKVRLFLGAMLVVVGLALYSYISPTPAHAGNWSVGMYTVNTCSWAGQQHCRWAVTELNFYPVAECSYITFKGTKVGGLSLTMDAPTSRPGYKKYGWGIPTTFALSHGDWQNSSYWRYYNTCK